MPKTKKSNDVDPAFPDFGHHRVECVTAVPRPARFIQILSHFCPWPPPANVSTNLAQLACVILRVGRDTPVNYNALLFHRAEYLRRVFQPRYGISIEARQCHLSDKSAHRATPGTQLTYSLGGLLSFGACAK